MSRESMGRLLHDLRAPAARARTYAKLLVGADEAERPSLLEALWNALDDLERLLREKEENLPSGS